MDLTMIDCAIIENKNVQCTMCDDTKKLEWWGIGEDGEPEEGIYDPCPFCEPQESSNSHKE